MDRKVMFPPVLVVSGNSMPEAWENAYLSLAENGVVYKRRDEEDNGDQIEARMTVVTENPDVDPFSHRMGGTNALDAPLLDYYMEMMGAKNTWVKDFNDPTDTRWDYMYSERLQEYSTSQGKLDQLKFTVQRLIERPSSRRTNMITWFPERDTKARHTPCLQRIWIQIVAPQESEDWGMDVQYEFRSRNYLDASFGNTHGLYMVGCDIRAQVEDALGKKLAMRLVDTTNSYHVNSKSYPRFLALLDELKKRRAEGAAEDRFMGRAEVIQGLEYARDEVENTILRQTEKGFKGDLGKERERVHAIGDRVFYLLKRYAA